ncbi:MAG: peptidoglycan-binding domain-containing protein [Candidatus Omnitrophica bacterium]|nr:peptidoglycan-binding domain-containing protein [Candidatus Omnitrophota bacterium]
MEQAQRVEELKAERAARSSGKTNVGIKNKGSRQGKEHTREIQTCLKNAGFYKGEVDGVKGRKTRGAIKKFQSANGLTADGVVGKKTWEALNKYTSGGAALSAGSVEEEASAK